MAKSKTKVQIERTLKRRDSSSMMTSTYCSRTSENSKLLVPQDKLLVENLLSPVQQLLWSYYGMGSSKNTATSKLKKGKMTKTSVKKVSNQKVDLRSRQYSLGRDSGSTVHYYKFTGKQTKNWKPVGKQLKEYLYHLIDSGVKMVGSKPQFSNNEDVQKLLDELKLQLKSNLHTVRVPNKRHGDYGKIQVKTDELREELESLTQQQLLLEKAIREEERSIEALEDMQNTSSHEKLIQKVPKEKLGLPRMVF